MMLPFKKISAIPSRAIFSFVLGVSVMTVMGVYFSKSQMLPYNVREIINQHSPIISSLGFSVTLYWCFGFSVWIAIRCLRRQAIWQKTSVLIVLYLVHGVVAWGLLLASVPLESIHDIIGTPVLGLGWKWELLGRFIAFFGIFSLLFSIAAMLAILQYPTAALDRRSIVHLTAVLLVLLALSYWVVIVEAATDNITELMANSGGFRAAIFISLAIFVLAITGTQISILFVRGIRYIDPTYVALIVVSFPLLYFSLNFGLETKIHKYGQEFSALQFLLSPDRSRYAPAGDLVLRLSVLHFVLVGLIGVVQYPFWYSLFYSNRVQRGSSG